LYRLEDKPRPEKVSVGRMLGRRDAFTAIAGRCSAAEAVQLRRIREDRDYLKICGSWKEFCIEHLHASRSNVDRIIALLDEFGVDYFVISQYTRVSPETYRILAPSIRNGALQVQGEEIALIPENATLIGRAVRSASTRKSIERSARREPAFHELVASIERRCKETGQDFRSLCDRFRSREERHQIALTLTAVKNAFAALGVDLGLS